MSTMLRCGVYTASDRKGIIYGTKGYAIVGSWVRECKLKKVVVTNVEYEVGTD